MGGKTEPLSPKQSAVVLYNSCWISIVCIVSPLRWQFREIDSILFLLDSTAATIACLFVHTQQKSPKIASSVRFDYARHHIIQNMITHNRVDAANCIFVILAKTIILLNKTQCIVYTALFIDYYCFNDGITTFLLPHSFKWLYCVNGEGCWSIPFTQWLLCRCWEGFQTHFKYCFLWGLTMMEDPGKRQVVLGEDSTRSHINSQWSWCITMWLFCAAVLSKLRSPELINIVLLILALMPSCVSWGRRVVSWCKCLAAT